MLKYMVILLFMISCSSNDYTGKQSDHFDGSVFFNPNKVGHNKGILDLFKWKFLSKFKQWPTNIEIRQQKILENRVLHGEGSITFINHSTVLIQLDGLNILTDPVWAKRTSPVSWAGPARVKKAGIKLEDLPQIDVVLISHNHYDHMDIETLKKLYEKDKPLFIVGLGNTQYLKDENISNIVELDWNGTKKIKGVSFEFSKCQHWSRRGAFDYNFALWGSFSILGSKKIYFAGDTGYSSHFQEASRKNGKYDLALLPIGAYEPKWFMKTAHMNPEEAVQAFVDLKAKKAVGIHFGTFQLTNEGINDPKLDLEKALTKYNINKEMFIVPENGQTFSKF